ncbi:MAG: helix-turn-helix domain-containing protein [Prolixibacteraceae bacterium]|nr:helix-turn-helix domain-containing protein [Prolixibacteraceae bacterium]MBN2774027.1 helix-turn-helix domain-containing protein [Prolixibacteraceae bacterium]
MNNKPENIPTYSLQNFSSPERGGQQFQVEVFDANRHFSVKYPHRHDFFEVLYLSNGSGFHVIDGNKYEIEPPCIFFMSPGQAHKIEFSTDIEGFIFIFTSDFYLINQNNRNRLIEFPFFFSVRQDNPPLVLKNSENVRFLESLFERGISEIEKKGYSTELLRSILDLILTTCASLYQNEGIKLNKGKGHILVKKFFQLIEENYHRKLSVNEYADILSVTPNHLTQTVISLTGKTSSQLIREKLILEIKRLLVHTNMSVTEIAYNLNFPDQSYFTKFFKRETNIAPLQFRTDALN